MKVIWFLTGASIGSGPLMPGSILTKVYLLSYTYYDIHLALKDYLGSTVVPSIQYIGIYCTCLNNEALPPAEEVALLVSSW